MSLTAVAGELPGDPSLIIPFADVANGNMCPPVALPWQSVVH